MVHMPMYECISFRVCIEMERLVFKLPTYCHASAPKRIVKNYVLLPFAAVDAQDVVVITMVVQN